MVDKAHFNCADCNFEHGSKRKFIEHVRLLHLNNDGKEKGFKCSHCSILFSYKGNLIRHIKKMHENVTCQPQVSCWVCGSGFRYRANMLRHIKAQHPGSSIPERTFKHKCTLCPHRYNHLYNLKCHMRKDHGTCLPEPLKYKCPVCSELVPSKMKLFFSHLNDKHGISILKKEFEFTSVNRFRHWKERIEKETNACFIRFARRGDVRDEYRCHRSGVFVSKSKGLRKLKQQGSKKIDSICPASITLYRKDKGTFKAVYIANHLGHENDMKHLRLSEKDRLTIACKIACNIPFDTILNDLSKTGSNSRLERKNLITKKDLYNIQSTYRLSSRKFEDDACLDWWVVETACTNNSCVIFYKTPGLNNHDTNNKDFMLILMNDLQSEILVNNSRNLICLDRTQCLNKHGFELITIYTVNRGSAFPCVFIITNKTDKNDFIYYFTQILEEVGKLRPEIIMTDLDSTLYDSWCEVMGSPKKRLYSPWHVDWSIRKHLSLVNNKEKQTVLYQSIINLIEENNEASFHTKLQLLLHSLENDQETIEFLLYFKSQFINNNSAWADYLREQSGYQAKNNLEQTHKTIKFMYLNKDNVKHVNKAVDAIMKYIRDRLTSNFVHIEDLDFKLKEIMTRHDQALLQYNAARILEQDKCWKVNFPDIDRCEVTITETSSECNCSWICTQCSVCLHKYSCTCSDSCLKWNMCEHIHLVMLYLNTTKNTNLINEGILYYDYINIENQDCINIDKNAHNIIPIPPTINVLSSINTNNISNTTNLETEHFDPNADDNISSLKNAHNIINEILHSNNVQCSDDAGSHLNDSREALLLPDTNDHTSNMDTLIETLDRRKIVLSQKINDLLRYVENVESVEMIDEIEKLLVPIETSLVALKKL